MKILKAGKNTYKYAHRHGTAYEFPGSLEMRFIIQCRISTDKCNRRKHIVEGWDLLAVPTLLPSRLTVFEAKVKHDPDHFVVQPGQARPRGYLCGQSHPWGWECIRMQGASDSAVLWVWPQRRQSPDLMVPCHKPCRKSKQSLKWNKLRVFRKRSGSFATVHARKNSRMTVLRDYANCRFWKREPQCCVIGIKVL